MGRAAFSQFRCLMHEMGMKAVHVLKSTVSQVVSLHASDGLSDEVGSSSLLISKVVKY